MYGPRRQCERSTFHAFLYTLRNPVDRLVSWYYYEHPSAKKNQRKCHNVRKFHRYRGNRKGCFKTLQEFAINCRNHTNATKCQKLAYSVASGQVHCGCSSHNALGYDWYSRKMQTMANNISTTTINHNITMLAIRTEHVAHDWDKLERRGNSHSTTISSTSRFQSKSGNARQGSNSTTRQDAFLLKRARLNLCRALCHEIQVYKKLLYAAQNLNPMEVHESLYELIATCPDETREIRKCPYE